MKTEETKDMDFFFSIEIFVFFFFFCTLSLLRISNVVLYTQTNMNCYAVVYGSVKMMKVSIKKVTNINSFQLLTQVLFQE